MVLKVTEGTVHECSKKIQEGFKKLQNIHEGLRRFMNVKESSKGSRKSRKVHEGIKGAIIF